MTRAYVAPLLGAAALATAACTGGDDDPAGAGSCTSTSTHVAMVRELAFGREEPEGVTPGFDVDGRISTGRSDPDGCRQADFVDPEGREGIDNQVALLVPTLEAMVGDAVDGILRGGINNGQLLIGVELSHVDDLSDDGCVDVAVQPSMGVPDLGTDGFLAPGQTFDRIPGAPVSGVTGQLIRDGLLESDPFELTLPIALLDARFTIHVHDARVRMRLFDDGSAEGVMGGGIEIAELIAIVMTLNIPPGMMETVASVLRMFADLDKEGDACTQLSAALPFRATPAFYF